jgi:hypothetical protein
MNPATRRTKYMIMSPLLLGCPEDYKTIITCPS